MKRGKGDSVVHIAHLQWKQYAGSVFFCECAEMVPVLVVERSLGFARDDRRCVEIYLVESRGNPIISV